MGEILQKSSRGSLILRCIAFLFLHKALLPQQRLMQKRKEKLSPRMQGEALCWAASKNPQVCSKIFRLHHETNYPPKSSG
jgi:hypothetical protein